MADSETSLLRFATEAAAHADVYAARVADLQEMNTALNQALSRTQQTVTMSTASLVLLTIPKLKVDRMRALHCPLCKKAVSIEPIEARSIRQLVINYAVGTGGNISWEILDPMVSNRWAPLFCRQAQPMTSTSPFILQTRKEGEVEFAPTPLPRSVFSPQKKAVSDLHKCTVKLELVSIDHIMSSRAASPMLPCAPASARAASNSPSRWSRNTSQSTCEVPVGERRGALQVRHHGKLNTVWLGFAIECFSQGRLSDMPLWSLCARGGVAGWNAAANFAAGNLRDAASAASTPSEHPVRLVC
ncbi:hypothetical protein BKA62DRAFT_676422 [Auriculariales sp. MPI-PUGE-AT-0066]|nr:hypothetical protein BKA62DRAFT_676422 [Auriculariales sp. MPI-PUGE-AT-0066]